MKAFWYQGLDAWGEGVSGVVVGQSREEVRRKLSDEKISVTFLKEEKRPSYSLAEKPFGNRKDLSLLCKEWATLLSVGIPLTETLLLLSEERRKTEKEVLGRIEEIVKKGNPLYKAMALMQIFPSFMVSLIEVGEKSGTLPEVLEKLGEYYRKEEEFTSKLKSSLSYPIFLFCFTFAVFFVILTFVLPAFALLFSSLHVEMSAWTKMLLAIGFWLRQKGFALLLFLLLSIGAAILYGKSVEGKRRIGKSLYNLSFYKRFLLIKFCSSLSTLLKSGEPLSEALMTAKNVVGNEEAEKAISYIQKGIVRGESFPALLKKSGFSVPLVYHLVKTGSDSGELPKFLDHGVSLLSQEGERKIEKLRAILEPAVILLVGLWIAILLITVVLPLLQTMSKAVHMG